MNSRTIRRGKPLLTLSLLTALSAALALTGQAADTGVAYGSINNFDTVNDNGVPCHGFEIELEDLESTDITYTYNWNHYGTPTIIEDRTSVPGHTKVIIRYASARNTDGTWAAYTAVPTGPIAPTDGHQFTNPDVNFGGEHFGVGYRRPPTSVKYAWLIDDGTGGLVRGNAVNVATPTFTYQAPAGGGPAQVQAVIKPPEPPEVHPLEFGPASWVKEIRTTSHNHNAVRLRDLVSDDPDDPDDKNWRNGEPDEVETEWRLLQTEFKKADGGPNGQLEGAPEKLPQGDEVITRRYEFYKYVGPIDDESGEAMTEDVGPDGIHGVGTKLINGVEVDLSTLVVVGDYIGAQMSALDVEAPLGLIDHLEDGEVNVPYTKRTVIIAGDAAFTATTAGALPEGMSFDATTGVVSGTPLVSGVFSFTVTAANANHPEIARTYAFAVAEPGEVLPPHSIVDVAAAPLEAGSLTGGGLCTNGVPIAITATPAPGFAFVNWTDNGQEVSRSARYEFTPTVNRSLVANFAPAPVLSLSASTANSITLEWTTDDPGFSLEQSAAVAPADWSAVDQPVRVVGSKHEVTITPLGSRGFFRLVHE